MSNIVTESGNVFTIDNICLDDICLKDIAHHLTKICRFGGALPFGKHYSVACHCINLYHYGEKQQHTKNILKSLLMHDAAEAYLGDVITGLKKHLPDYKKIENKVEGMIYEKYNINLSTDEEDIIKTYDKCILLDEVASFMPSKYHLYRESVPIEYKPLNINIVPHVNEEVVYLTFLAICDSLEITDER